jgi:hypothetical protein
VASIQSKLRLGPPAIENPESQTILPSAKAIVPEIEIHTHQPILQNRSTLTDSCTTEIPAHTANMPQSTPPSFDHLTLERRGQIFIITLQRGEQNRLNTKICNEVIQAFHHIQRTLEDGSEGAVITRGHNAKFWCTGVDLDERDSNPFANSDGFFPMIHTILDFPYPTVALITGHTFGGACPFALSHDYRVMNSERGFISMVRYEPSDRQIRAMLTSAAACELGHAL